MIYKDPLEGAAPISEGLAGVEEGVKIAPRAPPPPRLPSTPQKLVVPPPESLEFINNALGCLEAQMKALL